MTVARISRAGVELDTRVAGALRVRGSGERGSVRTRASRDNRSRLTAGVSRIGVDLFNIAARGVPPSETATGSGPQAVACGIVGRRARNEGPAR